MRDYYEVVVCNDLRDLDEFLGQKFDLVITEIAFLPRETSTTEKPKKELELKLEEYCKAGITFVIPKLIEAGFDFVVFSSVIGLCEEELAEIDENNESYLGACPKIAGPGYIVPSYLLEFVEETFQKK